MQRRSTCFLLTLLLLAACADSDEDAFPGTFVTDPAKPSEGTTRIEMTFHEDGTLSSMQHKLGEMRSATGSWVRTGDELVLRLQPHDGASTRLKARVVGDHVELLSPAGDAVVHVLKRK